MFNQERVDGVFERADQLVSSLDVSHRGEALALVSASRRVFRSDFPRDSPEVLQIKLELRRSSEVLARRGARAMPLAALGRAALARLMDADRDAELLLEEFERKLGMFGL